MSNTKWGNSSNGGAAASMRQKAVMNEAVQQRVAQATRTEAKVDERFKEIASNPFFKTAFNPQTNANEKKAEIAKILVATNDKAKDRAIIKELELFKEFLSEQREAMQKEIIAVSATDVIAKLQKTLGGMNQGLLDFDEASKPLTDMLDALYTLRTNGETYNAFVEIDNDRKREAEWVEREDAARKAIETLNFNNSRLESENRELAEQKGLFGFGGVKKEAQNAIDMNLLTINANIAEMEKYDAELKAIAAEKADHVQKEGKFATERAQLRKLLDISGDEHVARSKAIVTKALEFIDTSKEQVGELRVGLGDLDDQIDRLSTANNKITTVVAIMNEGIKDARKENVSNRDALAAAPVDEDLLVKTEREQKKSNVEQFVTALDDSARTVGKTYADLTKEAVNIGTMRTATAEQISAMRELHSDGIAGIAGKLNMSIQALNSAGLNEAGSAARDTLAKMNAKTDEIAQKEVIRVATDIDRLNTEVIKAFEDMSEYGSTIQASTQIRRQGIADMQANLAKLQDIAAETQARLQESNAVNADAKGGSIVTEKKTEKSSDGAADPFGFMKAG